jgi:hypothetical protein
MARQRQVTPGPALALVLLCSGFLSACIHVAPIVQLGEKTEAINLAKLLNRLAPDAQLLLQQEHDCADELKITMEEAGDKLASSRREQFGSFVDRLIVIRDRRKQIEETIRQTRWQSPMVHVIQEDAIVTLRDEVTRTQTWIQSAQNLHLRADLGRTKDFPELAILTSQLDSFLNEAAEEPLYTQIHALQEEYRFSDSELRP